MSRIHIAALVSAGLVFSAASATAGPFSPVGAHLVTPSSDVEQVRHRYYRNDSAVPAAIIGGMFGLMGGAVGGNCYYNDCGGDAYYGDDGYGYGGGGYVGGGGWGGGRSRGGGGGRAAHAAFQGGHGGGGGGHGGGGHGGGGHGGHR